jgi:hypothetical protein
MFVPTPTKCAFHTSSLRPYERRAFYNGTLHQYFPSKPQNILTEAYGSNWKVPDPLKGKHGVGASGSICAAKWRERQKNKTEAEAKLKKKKKEKARREEEKEVKGGRGGG